MTNKTMIAKAVKYALYSGFAASMAVTAPATFAAEEEAEEAEKIVVTGSRIKRTDIESATPVISITAEDMENAGRLTVADALRNATFNSFGSFNEQSGSSAQSQATISLLGAGADRTLVLMDGKRIPGSPTLGGTAVNLNTIPMAMVERIDVMKDAGSAIYGSDAIAGVINIVTKKNYDGVNITAGIGRPSKEGADSEEFSIVMGTSSDRGNLTVAFDHQVVDAIFDKDRPYTAASMEDLNGDGTIQAYFETQGISFYGATVYNPDTGLFQASPVCDDLTANVDGFVGELGGDAVFGPGGHTICGYAFANISANKASINRNSVFVNGEYSINDDVDFFTRMLFTHNRSFGRYAPAAAPFPFIPVGNQHNPSATTDTFGYFRWYPLGPRDNNVDDYSQDYLAGFRGMFGDSAEWEIAYHYNQADFKSVGNTYLSYTGLYTNLYLGEPFDSEDGLSALAATTLQEDRNIMHQVTAGVGFEFGELPGGPISFYVGGERIEQRYQSLVDKQSEGGWVGGSAGNSSGRDRQINAYYFESALPILDTLELNIAGRYDDYSDFGSETSPKVSLRFQPMDELLLRASWGEGFRAPTLAELSAADAFSAEFAIDYYNCFNNTNTPAVDCPEQQFDTTVQSNENLLPEESDFMNFGVVWSATDDLTVRFDYADVSIENAIGYVSVQDLVYMDLVGISAPAGAALCRNLQGTETPDTTGPCAGNPNAGTNGTGSINEAFTISQNGSSLDIKNVDLEFAYNLETEVGMFNFKWITSKILDYSSDVFFSGPQQDVVGFAGLPEMRSQFTTVWRNGDHAIAWNMDYIDGTAAAEDVVVTPGAVNLVETGSIESLLLHNMSYTYDSGEWGRYTLGARNITEEELPRSSGNAPVYNSNLYTPAHLGRTVYLNVSLDL